MADKEWAVVTRSADLGQFLQRQRQRRGITQAQLADELGLSRRYLVEIEQGKPSLYTDRLFAVLRELDLVLKVEER